LTGIIFTALLIAVSSKVQAQSSPLTVQPSTGRVGVGNTNPGYPLDVTGTVNATSFRRDGSQLTNVTGALLNKVTANTTVVNTAIETTLYSFSVPGGTLSTNNLLRLTLQITDLDVSDSSQCLLRFKYGGTTLAAVSIYRDMASLVNGKSLITFVIAGDGATNAQLGTAFFHGASSTFDNQVAQGTSAVDSTAAQTLTVTADWDRASNQNGITLGHAILEKLM
jgi:hypothetical protein